jgi:hypothetical protein
MSQSLKLIRLLNNIFNSRSFVKTPTSSAMGFWGLKMAGLGAAYSGGDGGVI